MSSGSSEPDGQIRDSTLNRVKSGRDPSRFKLESDLLARAIRSAKKKREDDVLLL
jgi:hypothetical protein